MTKKILNGIKKISPLEEVKKTERELRERTITLILAGFGLVAALAWNDAIQSFFNAFFPKSNGLIGKFIYAIIITLIVVIASMRLKKIAEKEE